MSNYTKNDSNKQGFNPLEVVKDFEEFTPIITRMSAVTPQQQPWFWPGVIPDEEVTLIAGKGGVGKSTMMLDIIAHVTTGDAFNCCGNEVTLPQGNVILMSAEDNKNYQIAPKLLAAQADMDKVTLFSTVKGNVLDQERYIDLNSELFRLEKLIEETGSVRMIVIDPASYFIGDVNPNDNKAVANFILKLKNVAIKHKLAILLCKHFRKSSGNGAIGNIVDEVGGASSWINSPRQAFGLIPHPDKPHIGLLFNIKTNIAKKTVMTLNFTQEDTTLENGIQTVRAVWGDSLMEITPEEAISKESMKKSKQERAQDIILTMLETGPKTIDAIVADLHAKQISQRTTQRAYLALEKENMIKRNKIDSRMDKKPSFCLPDVTFQN